jgi:Flp pilus assembly pilin Flp
MAMRISTGLIRFGREAAGSAIVEYALLASVASAAAFAAFGSVGVALNHVFLAIAGAL